MANCTSIRNEFSAYLDGAVSGTTMHAIAAHLQSCPACAEEFAGWESTQHAIARLGALKAPEDLGLRLRLAISREKAKQQSHWTDRFALQWSNVLGPLVMQASAGLAAAVLLVGSMVMMLGITPVAVEANDEPLAVVSAPHYLYTATATGPIRTNEDTVIVVAAEVNSQGQVYDYRILTGPLDEGVSNQVQQHLLMSVFEPARVFGSPVPGRAVVTFSGISVKG